MTATPSPGRPDPVRFVLASASPARLKLLRQVGIQPDRVVSGVDETRSKGPAAEVAATLASRKALAVAGRLEGDAVVLGCDSVLEHAGQVLGKPSSSAEALARWHALRGTTGRLHTGHCLVSVAGGRVAQVVEAGDASTVRFGTPTDPEVSAYVATGDRRAERCLHRRHRRVALERDRPQPARPPLPSGRARPVDL